MGAQDPNNDFLTYSLKGPDAAFFEIDQTTGQLRVGAALDFEAKRTYRVTVSVHDGADPSDNPSNEIDDSINVTITVTNVNEAPVVTGKTDFFFNENASGAAASYSARDPERDAVGWSVSGADGDRFIITSRGVLHFYAPPDFEDQETYRVTVQALDGSLTGPLYVAVTVRDKEEPGAVAITPPRGWVGLPLTAAIEDPDGGESAVSWQWSRSFSRKGGWKDIPGADSSLYIPADADEGHYLRATASYSDRRSSGKHAQTVMQRPVGGNQPAETNTPPQFASESVVRRVVETTTAARNVGRPIAAIDVESDVLTYSLNGTDTHSFNIDTRTGQIKTKSVLISETKASYKVTVSVHDGFDHAYNTSDSIDGTVEVTITVAKPSPPPPPRPPPPPPKNLNPTFTEGSRTMRSVDENTQPGTNIGGPVAARDTDGDALKYTVGGADAASFDIVITTGQLKTKAGLDYETTSTYTLTVSVSDGKNSSGGMDPSSDDFITVTITVVDVDEEGVVTFSEIDLLVDAEVTAALSDPDGNVSAITWQWERSADGEVWTGISGAAFASYKPIDTDIGSYLRATASYTDANGASKSASSVSELTVATHSVLDKYDTDGDRIINRDEVIQAVKDYFDYLIDKDEVLRAIYLYFASE